MRTLLAILKAVMEWSPGTNGVLNKKHQNTTGIFTLHKKEMFILIAVKS